MNLYLQYQNVDREGLPLSNPPFSATQLEIHTRRPHIQQAEGRVFLICGMARPRRYFLWETFEIQKVRVDSAGMFHAVGSGWQLAPPVELQGDAFEEFRSACANFIGFRSISDLPFAKTLNQLAEEHRPPGVASTCIAFLRQLNELLASNASAIQLVRTALGHDEPTLALSIRQPHAEAIIRGVKKIEYRSRQTRIRGRILIYSSLGRYSAREEAEMLEQYGIADKACDALPRGVLVGSVELFDCHRGEWHLRNPVRAETLIAPTNHPQPVWFRPF